MSRVVLMCGPSGAGKTTYARGLEAQGPENVAGDPAWQASQRPVEQHFGVEQGGPAMSGPSR